MCCNQTMRLKRGNQVTECVFRVHLQEVAKLRKEVQISKAALESSQAAAKKADAELAAAKAATEAATAAKTAAEKVCAAFR